MAILLYDRVEPLDFVGPFEAFLSGSGYGKDLNVYTAAEREGPIEAVGGLSVNPAYTLRDCPKPDILVIPGGWGSRQEMLNDALLQWIRDVSREVEVLLSVCTGALLLAKAGLLDGLKATTNRSAMDELRAIVPASTVVLPEARYVDNGRIVLSAGVSAGIDASLYVIGRLLGAERARTAATIMEYDGSGLSGSEAGAAE